MAKCEAKAGRLGCKLEAKHDEPFGPAELGNKRPRRLTPHQWAGKCDACQGGPVLRFHEDKAADGKVTFLHLCGRCQDRGGSVTSGMIVNGQECACGEPATRWLESIQAFLCAKCGPDKERVGEAMTPADFAKLVGPMSGLFPVHLEGDFWSLFEVRISAGQVTRAALLRDRAPYWEVLDAIEERARAQVTEAPQRAGVAA